MRTDGIRLDCSSTNNRRPRGPFEMPANSSGIPRPVSSPPSNKVPFWGLSINCLVGKCLPRTTKYFRATFQSHLKPYVHNGN